MNSQFLSSVWRIISPYLSGKILVIVQPAMHFHVFNASHSHMFFSLLVGKPTFMSGSLKHFCETSMFLDGLANLQVSP